MEPSHVHACPNCAAPAQDSQRWCLECGSELPQPRRGGLRPAVGIATTLAVLVGAASAGGYTLLQHGKQPPPPPTTVAQAPPPPTTLPPATEEPGPSTYAAPSYTPPTYSSSMAGGTGYGGVTSYRRATTTPTYPRPGGGDTGGAGYGGGTVTTPSGGGGDKSAGGDENGGTTPPPRKVLTNVALGAAAVVYAPYTASDVDLGDASRVADASTRTVWKTPAPATPGAAPQVGVYIDLAGREHIRKLVLETPTPGMSVEVYGAVKGPPAQITDAGWDHLATRKDLAKTTTFHLHDQVFRYVLVWITGLPPNAMRAAISELSLLSLQPE